MSADETENASPESPDGDEGEERRDPNRRRRSRVVGRVLGLLSLGIALALFQFTQTATGRNAAVALLQGALDKAVNGHVRIGPVLGGNLVTRAVLSSFEITDLGGNTFIAMDTVSIEYDPLQLLRRQIRVRRLDAANADILLSVDADGTWNFERIFVPVGEPPADTLGLPEDSVAAGEDSTGSPDSLAVVAVAANPLRFIMGDATIRNGSFEVRTPWTAGLEGSDRERALAEARNSMWHAEETPDGEFERVYRIEGFSGQFPLLRIIDPPRPLHVELENVGGRVTLVSSPLDVERFSGDVVFGDTIRVTIDRLDTPGSRLAGSGRLVPGEPPSFDFDLRADPLAFADLAWLPVPIPGSGGGRMDISLTSREEVVVVEVRDADVRSEDTSIRGGFRLALEPTPRFESLDATLQPLRLAWLDELLDRDPLIDGNVTGTVSGSGRVDDLTIDAELTLQDPDGVGGSPSVLNAAGRVGMVEPFPVSEMRLLMRGFEPRWVGVLGIDAPIPGRIGGSVTIDRPAGSILSFAGDLSHMTPEGDVSAVSGTGTIDVAEGSVVDFSIEFAPLALAAVQSLVPDLELVGSVSGPMQARGTLQSLTAQADLVTPRGLLKLEGMFGFVSDTLDYDATIEASDIAVDQWVEGAPESRLALRGRVTGRGIDPSTLAATFDLEVLPSEFERADLDLSLIRFHVEEGLARIDTLILQADVGTISARGEFGLAADRSGTLEWQAEAADLSELNRWVAEGIPGGVDSGEEIFASFAAAIAEPSPEEDVQGLLGSAVARGVVVGTLEDFVIEGQLEAGDVRYGRWGADTLSLRARFDEPPTLAALAGRLTATGVLVDGVELDSLEVDVERVASGPYDASIYARRDSVVQAEARGAISVDAGDWRVALEHARVRLGKVESSLVDPAVVVYSDSLLMVDGLVVTGPLGRFEADGSIGAEGRGDLALQLTGLRIEQFGYLWSNRSVIGGTMSGTAAITGSLAQPEFQGTIRVLDPAVRTHRYSSLDTRFDYSNRRLGGSLELTRDGNPLARIEGTVEADLAFAPVERRLLPEPLDLRIVADSLPLQLLELRVQGLEELDGVAAGSLTLSGEPGQLRYGGTLTVRGGRAWVPDLGVRMVAVNGGATFQGREARLDSVALASEAGGTAVVTGRLDLSSLTDPVLDLDLRATALQAVARRDLRLAIEGTGHLGGRYRAPEITGHFRLRDGDIRQDEFLRERQVIDLSDPAFYRLLDSASVRERQLLDRFRNDFMDNLRLDVELDLGPNLWLRSPTIDVEMIADGLDVSLDQAREEMRIVGTIELPRGTYRFDRIPPYVQALRITEGTIQFVGNPEFNPNLDISAEYRNRAKDGPVLINVRIGGTLLSTDLLITSTPPMSDTDELCFLAVGAPCIGSGDSQLGQRLVQETLLGTLSSGLSSALVGSTGLSYFNLTSTGASQSGSLQSDNLFNMTAVEFGWYAGERVFFTFKQPLRGGLPRATVEWSFTSAWSLEAKVSSRFDDRLFGLDHSSFQDVQTFGLFLFREWSY